MFNDSIAAAKFKELAARWKPDLIVETGTHMGMGAFELAQYAPVVTIEINPAFRGEAVCKWILKGCKASRVMSDFFGIRLVGQRWAILSFLGSSPEVMRSECDEAPDNTSCIFYLDAHWCDPWPILDELRVIKTLPIKNKFIIIHDFKVPDKPFGYDSYGDQPLDWDYVKTDLLAINPDFHVFYNETVCEGISGRGILYAEPPL